MKDRMRIGITGSTGVLGHRITELAVEKGLHVKSLVRRRGKIDKLSNLNLSLVYGDITDSDSLVDFVKDIDVCIHLAAHVSFGTKKEYYKTNVDGTKNICRAIVKYNPECRLIYCSTISALKVKRFIKCLSTDYAISKYLAERQVEFYKKEKGLKAVIIYPGLIFGPNDTKFLPYLIKYLKEGRLFFVSGGEERGPLIYIDDLCELFLIAAIREDAIGKRYLGVGNLEIGIHDFIKIVAQKIGKSPPMLKIPKSLIFPVALLMETIYALFKINKAPMISKRVVDVLSINFDPSIKNIHQNLEWKPMVSVVNGIDHALKWYKKQYRENIS
ncbi:MAG: NAD-dependent epimerase/dehydratase family protein [Nitrospirota bacterium]